MTPLIAESWIWWSVVIVVAGCRFVSRRIVLGAFRHFQWDDYLMGVVLCFYTALIATINIVSHTASNLLPPGFNISTLTPANIKERTFGSKLILVVEECQCTTIWGAKACLIIMYLRLTTFRKEHIAIKLLAAYVAINFVVMEILYLGVWCRPFHEYWAVPTNNVQCDAATNHLITNAVFNLTSDCAMLIIGLPMFLRLKLPWRKKVPLIMIFSLGIFVILAAILNKVYSFTEPYGAMWTFWYVRESSTALLVANLPFVWGVLKIITGLRSQTASPNNTRDLYNPELTQQHDDSFCIESMLGSARRPSKQKKPSADSETLARALRPQRPRRGDFTLEQMLAESCVPDPSEGEPNIYTHPLKYFSQQAAMAGRSPLPPMGKVLTRESGETVRRTSDPEMAREAGTPLASIGPSLNSRRSEGSFV